MLTVIPGVVQHPALPRYIRHHERIPVHKVGLPLRIAIDLRAYLFRVAIGLHLWQDKTIIHSDRDCGTWWHRLWQYEFQPLGHGYECVIGNWLVIHRKGFETEPATP